MGVEIGLALTPGPLPGQTNQWLDQYDRVLPSLQAHVASLWMPDHFFWGAMPTYEAMTVLSFLAARFPAFQVGSSVLSQSYRNPALVAKMASTLHALSRGRFILGLGAGWKEDEYRAYHYPYPPAGVRLQQLDEALTIIRTLWTRSGPVDFMGQHYELHQAYCEPRPDPPPVIMVGGGGRTTMRLAAKHADWWNLSDVSIETYRERQAILHAHCQALGRDVGSLRQTWFGRLVLGESAAAARRRGQTGGRSHYAGWTVEGAMVGTPAQVIEQIRAFVAAGVDYFMFEILDVDQPAILRLAVDEVLPAVRQLSPGV